MNNTPQGEAIEGNTADDILMVDQGGVHHLTNQTPVRNSIYVFALILKKSSLCAHNL
jgi:hypothetical protein